MRAEITKVAKKFSMGKGRLVDDPSRTSERDYRLKISLPFYRDWCPGQFVMIKWGRHAIGRPFAIVDWRPVSARESHLSLWIRRLGAGTEELFETAFKGMPLQVTAPLGNGFDDSVLRSPKILMLSGGVGGASVLPLAMARADRRSADIWIHGERDESFLDRELAGSEFCPRKIFVESPISKFLSGRVTDGLKSLTASERAGLTAIIACGPSVMLEAVARETSMLGELSKLPLHLGLEERMGCGIGLCFSCSVWTSDGMKRLCTEGPWFEATRIPDHFRARCGEAPK